MHRFDQINATTEPFTLDGGSYTIAITGHGGGSGTLEQRGTDGIFGDTAEPPFPMTGQSAQRSGVELSAGVYRFALVDAEGVDIVVERERQP